MPSETFSHTVDIDVPTATAWAALQDPDIWSSIGPVSSVSNPAYRDDGTLASFDWVADIGGKKYDGAAIGGDYVINEEYTLTLDTSEIAGDVIATLDGTADTTSVTIEITFRTKGMLSAMFFPAIKQALASGFPGQVEDIAASIQN
ncbi:MAG: SRPBCC family protein [Acidimicrobiia bacterium]